MNKPTGLELIARERMEQVTKHGRLTTLDVKFNTNFELSRGASVLACHDWGCNDEGDMLEHMPGSWDKDICKHMLGKPYKERLVIAGALIAAELDRLTAVE